MYLLLLTILTKSSLTGFPVHNPRLSASIPHHPSTDPHQNETNPHRSRTIRCYDVPNPHATTPSKHIFGDQRHMSAMLIRGHRVKPWS
jgi:hypothetical protein